MNLKDLLMPWRAAYLTTRRHPIALAMYLFTFAIGALFIYTHADAGEGANPLFAQIGPVWRWAWRVEFLVGGLGAFTAALWKPKMAPHWPDLADLIRLEAIGAFVSAMAFTTYLVAFERLVGHWDWGLLIYGLLTAGLFWRATQAFFESRFADRMGRQADEFHEAIGTIRRGVEEASKNLRDG